MVNFIWSKSIIAHLVVSLTYLFQICNCSPTVALSGGITLKANLIGSTQIQFVISSNSSGWVGFGYGTWMWYNDIFVIQASGGSGTISDMKCNRHRNPVMDVVNNYVVF